MRYKAGDMVICTKGFRTTVNTRWSFKPGKIYKVLHQEDQRLYVKVNGKGIEDWWYIDSFIPATKLAILFYSSQ